MRQRLEAAGGAPPPPGASVAALDHLPELDALCLALSSGELLLLGAGGSSSPPWQPPAVEEVGAVDGGLAAAAWSPDGELLVLVTCAGSLLLMNKVRHAALRRAVLGHAVPCMSEFHAAVRAAAGR